MSSAAKWVVFAVVAAGLSGCDASSPSKSPDPPVKHSPAVPDVGDPESFQVKFETTKGDFVVEVNPSWSPNGAKRIRELVEIGFYDGCKFFRVLDGFMAQVGMNGDPLLNQKWMNDNIPDDPVKQSNKRGFVTFAKTGAPNSRSTQLFVNYADNANLDGMGFAPIGRVIEGMDVVDRLYSGYGEGAPMGNGPDQGRIIEGGNAYLEKDFPMLDAIKTARIVSVEPDQR